MNELGDKVIPYAYILSPWTDVVVLCMHLKIKSLHKKRQLELIILDIRILDELQCVKPKLIEVTYKNAYLSKLKVSIF